MIQDAGFFAAVVHTKSLIIAKGVLKQTVIPFTEIVPLQLAVKAKGLHIAVNVLIFPANF